MSTGYGWEGIRQVCATLLGARHVPERLCGGRVYLGAITNVRPLPFFTDTWHMRGRATSRDKVCISVAIGCINVPHTTAQWYSG